MLMFLPTARVVRGGGFCERWEALAFCGQPCSPEPALAASQATTQRVNRASEMQSTSLNAARAPVQGAMSEAG